MHRQLIDYFRSHRMRYGILLLLGLSLVTAKAQTDTVWVCDVQFKDSQFNNKHAGSGFLLRHGENIYGITAKHVLFFAKTDSMNSISFGDQLESWTLRSANGSGGNIKLGKLINEDTDEKIAMPPKGDWLVFETTGGLPENAAIHTLRKTPLEIGEEVFFMGFPYDTEKPIRVNGRFTGFTADGNLSLEVPKGNYGGCSGGPVVDSNGELVGIVSMGYFNDELNKQIFEPASLDYFKQVMTTE